MKKFFKEFYICPKCNKPLIEKNKLKMRKMNYCTQCGAYIARDWFEALAMIREN